jgi:hypothetical protein
MDGIACSASRKRPTPRHSRIASAASDPIQRGVGHALASPERTEEMEAHDMNEVLRTPRVRRRKPRRLIEWEDDHECDWETGQPLNDDAAKPS